MGIENSDEYSSAKERAKQKKMAMKKNSYQISTPFLPLQNLINILHVNKK